MKRSISIIICLLFSIFVNAQATEKLELTKAWKYGSISSLNLSQIALQNWVAGGKTSISATGAVGLYLNYQKDKHFWKNTLDLALGGIQEEGTLFKKTDDKIEFTSKYGRNIGEETSFSALTNFKTQFLQGFDTKDGTVLVSEFLAPGYLLLSLGFDYIPKKNALEGFTVFLSPATSKMTFVNNVSLSNLGAYGVDTGKSFRAEIGAFLKVKYTKEILKNVNLRVKGEFYSNYLHNPQNIDILGELLLNMKINDYLSTNISFNVIYDDDVKIAFDTDGDGVNDLSGPRTQIKEVFGLGLAYKFNSAATKKK